MSDSRMTLTAPSAPGSAPTLTLRFFFFFGLFSAGPQSSSAGWFSQLLYCAMLVSQSHSSSLSSTLRYAISCRTCSMESSTTPSPSSTSSYRRATSSAAAPSASDPSPKVISRAKCSGRGKPARLRMAIIAPLASATSSSVTRNSFALAGPVSVFRSSYPSSSSEDKSPPSSDLSNLSAPSSSMSAAVLYVSLCVWSRRNSSMTCPNRSSSACPKIRGSSSSSSPISSESYPAARASNCVSRSRNSAPGPSRLRRASSSSAWFQSSSSKSSSRSVPASEPPPLRPPPNPKKPPLAASSSSSSSSASSSNSSSIASSCRSTSDSS